MAHFISIHNLPSFNLKCDQCDFIGHDENLLNVHKINNHEEVDYSPMELIKVFYNAIGSMLQETNERMAKINNDTNQSLLYLMDNQAKLVDSVDYIKNEVALTKSSSDKEEVFDKIRDSFEETVNSAFKKLNDRMSKRENEQVPKSKEHESVPSAATPPSQPSRQS